MRAAAAIRLRRACVAFLSQNEALYAYCEIALPKRIAVTFCFI